MFGRSAAEENHGKTESPPVPSFVVGRCNRADVFFVLPRLELEFRGFCGVVCRSWKVCLVFGFSARSNRLVVKIGWFTESFRWSFSAKNIRGAVWTGLWTARPLLDSHTREIAAGGNQNKYRRRPPLNWIKEAIFPREKAGKLFEKAGNVVGVNFETIFCQLTSRKSWS